MQGIFLILYILLVSGLIAVVGDRVGHRIGKKKLSWFNLRPRDTAVVVAVSTGVIISGLTLATLLVLNRSLSDALFNYNRTVTYYRLYTTTLNQQLEGIQNRLNEVTLQRGDAQERLAQLIQQQEELQKQRDDISEKLKASTRELELTQEQYQQAQQELKKAQEELVRLKKEATTAGQQVTTLQKQTQSLKTSKQDLQLDRDQLERSLAVAQASLETVAQLEDQKKKLQAELADLIRTTSLFRRGSVSILVGDVLTTGVIDSSPQGSNPILRQTELQKEIDQILAKAEYRARELGAQAIPPFKTAIQMRREDITSLLNQVSQPGSWAIRILSASNRLRGEPVPVIANVYPNERLFQPGDVLASVLIQPNQSEDRLQQSLLRLLSMANTTSQKAGLLSDPLTGTVGEFSQVKLLEAVDKLKGIQKITTVHVVAEEAIYTAGPLKVSFLIQSESLTQR